MVTHSKVRPEGVHLSVDTSRYAQVIVQYPQIWLSALCAIQHIKHCSSTAQYVTCCLLAEPYSRPGYAHIQYLPEQLEVASHGPTAVQ